MAMSVVTKFIKWRINKSILNIVESVIPVVFVSERMVKDSRVPVITACKNDMREFVEFRCCVRLHFQIRKSIDDVEGYDVTVIRANALCAANFHGAVINIVLVGFKLS